MKIKPLDFQSNIRYIYYIFDIILSSNFFIPDLIATRHARFRNRSKDFWLNVWHTEKSSKFLFSLVIFQVMLYKKLFSFSSNLFLLPFCWKQNANAQKWFVILSFIPVFVANKRYFWPTFLNEELSNFLFFIRLRARQSPFLR